MGETTTTTPSATPSDTTTTTAAAPSAGASSTGPAAAYPPGQGGMVPPPEALPQVLPTDRLLPTGKARPPLRDELRRIPNLRNVGNVASVWIQSFGVIALACWIDHPLG